MLLGLYHKQHKRLFDPDWYKYIASQTLEMNENTSLRELCEQIIDNSNTLIEVSMMDTSMDAREDIAETDDLLESAPPGAFTQAEALSSVPPSEPPV